MPFQSLDRFCLFHSSRRFHGHYCERYVQHAKVMVMRRVLQSMRERLALTIDPARPINRQT